jgi:uncharacterized membrane protein YeaQ/YmgE (transglycosylase-associated protein family)
MDTTSILVSLISGAVGGNVAGAAMKESSLGTIGNSLAGIFGGGIGGALLSVMGMAPQGQILGDVAGGGVGGAVLMLVIALVKKSMAKA